MATKRYRWTVDVERDWGGRTNAVRGLTYGLPKILEIFSKYSVKGLFFISTELLRNNSREIAAITKAGHEVGSHGHFHHVWDDWYRAEEDRQISLALLSAMFGDKSFEYRAPKFSHKTVSQYSDKSHHTSLLRQLWAPQPITNSTIFYVHPFDIINDRKPPSLFCRAWYSRPKEALSLLERLVKAYSGDQRL